MTHRLTCINCPLGCEMDVWVDCDGAPSSVTGNACPRGKIYAAAELANPVRMVTTTVRIRGAEVAALPVKTSCPVPKAMVERVAASLAGVCVDAPVALGAVVARNACGTGADVVATRTLGRAWTDCS